LAQAVHGFSSPAIASGNKTDQRKKIAEFMDVFGRTRLTAPVGASTRWRIAGLTRIDALHSAPYLHLVAGFRQDMAAPNGGIVTNELAAMHRNHLVLLDDADFVIVHDLSPIFGMGIELALGKGCSTN